MVLTSWEVRMRDRLIEQLFSLLTSADRAEAIAGDLVEERDHRGWGWSGSMRSASPSNCGTRCRGRAATGACADVAVCAISIAPVFGGAVAAFLFPQMIGLMVFVGSAGALFNRHLSRRCLARLGFAASATLAVVGVLWCSHV